MKQKDNKTLVSVIMPVYNVGLFLRQAIQSIIKQSYQNWEMIVVDDASTDDSLTIAQEFAKKDKRIKVFKQKEHLGVASVANLAIKKAKGQYLARMDADDISSPSRLKKQVNFLKDNPQVIMLGGQCELINSQGRKIGEKSFPLNSEQIYEELMTHLPVQQPATMVNRQLLPKNFVFYQQNIPSGEEHQLLFRLFQYGEVHNLPDTLLKYRIHGKNTSMQRPKRDFYHIFWARLMAIFKWNYQITFKGLFFNFAQLFLVSILPNRYIYPVFYSLQEFLNKLTIWRENFPVAIGNFKSNI